LVRENPGAFVVVTGCYAQLEPEAVSKIDGVSLVLGSNEKANLIQFLSEAFMSRNDIATYKTYEGLVEYFLFDTKCPSIGGSGQQFNWSVLSAYDGSTPFLLSGGIGPDDAERLRALRVLDGFPVERCAGIDLNSRFELAPGLKDVIKLQAFIKELSI
jgi:phosphoribosylanthranilate isomerase